MYVSRQKYSINPIAQRTTIQLHITQPQREGDGRQALVVPPLYPTPATSLTQPAVSPVVISSEIRKAQNLNTCGTPLAVLDEIVQRMLRTYQAATLVGFKTIAWSWSNTSVSLEEHWPQSQKWETVRGGFRGSVLAPLASCGRTSNWNRRPSLK